MNSHLTYILDPLLRFIFFGFGSSSCFNSHGTSWACVSITATSVVHTTQLAAEPEHWSRAQHIGDLGQHRPTQKRDWSVKDIFISQLIIYLCLCLRLSKSSLYIKV